MQVGGVPGHGAAVSKREIHQHCHSDQQYP